MYTHPILTTIPTTSILIEKEKEQTFDKDHVKYLADSLTEISQLSPIYVQKIENNGSVSHKIIDGYHRFAAANQKKLADMQAYVFASTVSDNHIRRCILESKFLKRKDSWPIRALQLVELKELYELDYPQTKKGKHDRKNIKVAKRKNTDEKHKATNSTTSFVDHIVNESNDKSSTIHNLIMMANGLGEAIMKILAQYNFKKKDGMALLAIKDEQERKTILEKMIKMKVAKRSGRKAKVNVGKARYELAREHREKKSASIDLTGSDVDVINDCMQNYNKSEPNSVSAIVTDPLYHGNKTSLYDELGKFASRFLKPGGFAAIYCGRLHLNEVLCLLGQHLSLRTIITLHHKQHYGNCINSKLSADGKYILLYQKDGADVDFYASVPSIIEGTGMQKDTHEFQQNTSDLFAILDAVSSPGDIIADPFAGSGTTGVACVEKGRKAILIEEKECHYKTCLVRVNDALEQRRKKPIPFPVSSMTQNSIENNISELQEDDDGADMRNVI